MPVEITAARTARTRPTRSGLRIRRKTVLDSASETPMYRRRGSRFRRTLDDSDSDDDTILTDISEPPESDGHEKLLSKFEGLKPRVDELLDASDRVTAGLEILKRALDLFAKSHTDLERIIDSATQRDRWAAKRDLDRKLIEMRREIRGGRPDLPDTKFIDRDRYLIAYTYTFRLAKTRNAPVFEMAMVSWKVARRAVDGLRNTYQTELYKELVGLRQLHRKVKEELRGVEKSRMWRVRSDYRRTDERMDTLEAMVARIEAKISSNMAINKNKRELKEALGIPKKLWRNRMSYFSGYP